MLYDVLTKHEAWIYKTWREKSKNAVFWRFCPERSTLPTLSTLKVSFCSVFVNLRRSPFEVQKGFLSFWGSFRPCLTRPHRVKIPPPFAPSCKVKRLVCSRYRKQYHIINQPFRKKLGGRFVTITEITKLFSGCDILLYYIYIFIY